MSVEPAPWTLDWSDPDDIERPEYGPPCPGPTTHRWTLRLESDDVSVRSGCAECDAWMETYMVDAELVGRLTFEHEHEPRPCPNFLDGPCDHAWWWRFTPEVTGG